MKDTVEKLEKLLGESYESWTRDTLAKIIDSEEAINLFTPELVVHLLLERKNDELLPTLLPVKFGFDIRAVKAKIEEQLVELRENNGTMENYRSKVLALKEINNPIFRTAVYLTEVASFGDDYDVSKEEVEIKAAIAELKKLLDSLNMDDGFQVILEILDILYPLKELYFQRYQVDLLDGDTDFDTLLEALNKKSKEMIDMFNQMKEQGLIPDDEEEKDSTEK
jgi:pentatricopeptide repeat protein